jgi:hypothetical protein
MLPRFHARSSGIFAVPGYVSPAWGGRRLPPARDGDPDLRQDDAGRRVAGTYRPRSASPAVSQPPAHGFGVVDSSRPPSGPPTSRTITAGLPSGGTLPPSPLSGTRQQKDSTGAHGGKDRV